MGGLLMQLLRARPHSVIVINNGGLAIWAQTDQFVCPQSRLDKWSQFHWVLCIKQNRCSQGWWGVGGWEGTGGNVQFCGPVFTAGQRCAAWA